MSKITPTKKAIEEAKRNANGWVYVIDNAFEKEKNIPPEAIIGCWKVNENGEITGEFISNPRYVDLNKLT